MALLYAFAVPSSTVYQAKIAVLGSASGSTKVFSYQADFDVATSGNTLRWIPSGATGPVVTKYINEEPLVGVTCFATGATGYVMVKGTGTYNWYGFAIRPKVGNP